VRTADLGNTPLILAARRAGNSQTVRLLLERGAGAAERDGAGIQPDHGGGGERRPGDGAIAADAGAKAGDFRRPINRGTPRARRAFGRR